MTIVETLNRRYSGGKNDVTERMFFIFKAKNVERSHINIITHYSNDLHGRRSYGAVYFLEGIHCHRLVLGQTWGESYCCDLFSKPYEYFFQECVQRPVAVALKAPVTKYLRTQLDIFFSSQFEPCRSSKAITAFI